MGELRHDDCAHCSYCLLPRCCRCGRATAPPREVHGWAFEIRDECDMMRCGLIIYFTSDGAIVGNHDFVLDGDDGITCPGCLAPVRERVGADVDRRRL